TAVCRFVDANIVNPWSQRFSDGTAGRAEIRAGQNIGRFDDAIVIAVADQLQADVCRKRAEGCDEFLRRIDGKAIVIVWIDLADEIAGADGTGKGAHVSRRRQRAAGVVRRQGQRVTGVSAARGNTNIVSSTSECFEDRVAL